jgi:hypothetical protein
VYQINISNQERVHPHRWEIFAQWPSVPRSMYVSVLHKYRTILRQCKTISIPAFPPQQDAIQNNN